ncbi:hypothetical protein LCGC14_0865120 [marine sediment metagenome]|uniref:Uncharacterized protein n=1 Tax=marine sediment metagenome TaxID=412755 RepID=A0A0F9PB99_9ZZZZ
MAYGDISAVLDTQAVAAFLYPRIVHLDGDYVGVVGYSGSNGGYLRTYTINSAGAISNTEVDSWNFAAYGVTPDIIKIPDATDKYLLGYEPSGSADGEVKSLTISITGTITESFIDTLTMTAGDRMFRGRLSHTSNVNDICFSNCYEGQINSYTVDNAGNIGASIIDVQDYGHTIDDSRGIINIDGNYYATGYADTINTFSTDGSGNITAVDSWTVAPTQTGYVGIVKVPNSTIYIAAYRNGDGDGELFTFSISDTGVITKSAIDTLIFEGTDAVSVLENILYLGGDYFAVTCVADVDGRVYTFSCDNSGNLSASVLDSLEFYDGSVNVCGAPSIIHVQDDIYAAVHYYAGSDSGFIRTFSIEVPTVVTATFSSDSNVHAEDIETFNSNSHLWDTVTATFNSDSNIYAEEVFNSDSNIYGTVTATFNSDSHLWDDIETATFSSDSYLYGADPTVFTYAEVTAADADIVTNYNAFDIKLKHVCNHKLDDVQYVLTTCPRCLGRGYYYDIRFNEAGKPLEVALVDKLTQTLEKFVLTENNDFHSEVAINVQQWLGEFPIAEIKSIIKFELSKSLMILMETQRGVPNLSGEAQIASIDSIEIFEDVNNPGSLDYAVTITTVAGNSRELTGTVVLNE